MTTSFSRGVLFAANLIAALALYIGLYIALENRGMDDPEALLVGTVVTAAFFGLMWFNTCRDAVNWSARRRRLTLLSPVWSAALASPLGLAVWTSTPNRYQDEEAIIIAGLLWLAIWIASTVYIWRESPAERAGRRGAVVKGQLRCPSCRYSMAGLHEARCPECGTQYRLEELYALLLDANGAGTGQDPAA